MKNKKPKFKCALNKKHVDRVKLTKRDVNGVLDFFVGFKIPTTRHKASIRREIKKADRNTLHDLAHELLDDLIKAKDKKHKGLKESYWGPIIKQLKVKQRQCHKGTEE